MGWYQLLEAEVDNRAAVHWMLARPGIFVNSAGDLDLLPAVLRAADELGAAPPDTLMVRLSERARLASILGL